MTTTRALPVLEPGCCRTRTSALLGAAEAQQLAGLLKAVADPARLRLLSLIAGAPSGETCVCDLTGPVELSQPTVSHHLKILVDSGLLAREQRGRWAYYRMVPGAVESLTRALLAPLQPSEL